jgi:hypothetical protein
LVERWNRISADPEDQEPAKPEDVAQRRTHPKAGLADWLNRISLEPAPLMNDGRTSKEMMDELYDDETGLPK